MGLYNMLFGQSANADTLLKVLQLSRSDFYRYRDCYLANTGEIAVYTRGGGGNRECWTDECGNGNHVDTCVITMQSKLRDHGLYLRDEDDDFDCTYATFYFKVPEQLPEEITPEIKRDEAWQNIIKELGN